MRILLLTHIYPPATDGGSKIIAKIGEQLKKHGADILVLTSNCYTTDDFVTSKSSVLAHQSTKVLEHQSTSVLRLPVYRFHRRLPKPIFKLFPFLKALVTIIKFKPDFIIAGPFPTLIPLYAFLIKYLSRVLAHQRTRVLLIPCFHEFDPEFSQKHLLFCLNHADLICTLTQHEFSILNTIYKIPDTNLFVMRAGVDKTLIKSRVLAHQRTSGQLVFLGNFSAHKRVELLIQAFSDLAHQSTRALTLLLAGQRTLYWPQIQKVIDFQPVQIKKNIIVHLKNYSTRELEHYLTPGSILVLPSIHESFGLVFIESLARGIPVIGANIAPVTELLKQSGGGLTFKKDDLPDLINIINRLFNNPDLYHKLAITGHKYVKDYLTWDTIGNNLWQKLQKC